MADYSAGAAVNDTTHPATLTSVYPDSQVKSFHLRSFYFGCLETANFTQIRPDATNLPDPTNCTITVNGYGSAGTATLGVDATTLASIQPDVTAKFDYILVKTQNRVMGINKSSMALAVLPAEFRKLKTVTFQAALKGKAPQGMVCNLKRPILSVDNVSYTTSNATNAGDHGIGIRGHAEGDEDDSISN